MGSLGTANLFINQRAEAGAEPTLACECVDFIMLHLGTCRLVESVDQ